MRIQAMFGAVAGVTLVLVYILFVVSFAPTPESSVEAGLPPVPTVTPTPLPPAEMSISDGVVALGQTFQAEVSVDDPGPGYFSIQSHINLPLAAGAADVIAYQPSSDPADEALWPDCTIPARSDNVSTLLFACVPLPHLTVPSLFTGPVLSFTFLCQNEGVAMLHLFSDAEVVAGLGTYLLDLPGRPLVTNLTDGEVTCAPDTDGDGIPNPSDPDDDNDGCGDIGEVGRGSDPLNFWDFFDTPDGTNVRDGAIGASDIARIVGRFGTTGDPTGNPLSLPPIVGYHTAFDRSVMNGFSGPADGVVNAADIALVVAQFGEAC